jgi:hypothetical protein
MLSEDECYILYKREFHPVTYADRIQLIKKNVKVAGGMTIWRVEEPYNDKSEIKYLVHDGENYAHGKTLREAKDDLLYKTSDRDTSVYEVWKSDPGHVITKADAIKGYRAITGACEAGVRNFVSKLKVVPEKLTVTELIDITAGQYGNDTLRAFVRGDANG